MYFNEIIEKNKSKIIVISTLILLIFFVFLSIFLNARNHEGKVLVTVEVIPKDSIIILNNQKISNKDIYLKPGKYTYKVEHKNFSTYKSSLIVSEKSHPNILVGLSPNNEKGQKWYKRNKSAYREIQQKSFEISKEYNEYMLKKWPIVNSLPIKDPYFTIGYTRDGNENITITINAPSARYRQEALNFLIKKGFDPTNYKIDFIGYKNPLTNNYEKDK